MNIATLLRKVCNHPYLIEGVEDKVITTTTEDYYHQFIHNSGKLILLDKLLPEFIARGSKVLIFSQMVRVLDLLETYMRYRGYLYERLDGSIRGNIRQAAIDRFTKADSNIFCFLLCTRTGGLGINITAADTVIIYDSDWNPQNDVLALSRCHRIGQTKDVKIYRLITKNTYDSVMFEFASKKLKLNQAVLNIGSEPTPTGTKEIDALLRYGAYDLFKESDTQNQDGPYTFEKASFPISENDININDPNFWERILPHE